MSTTPQRKSFQERLDIFVHKLREDILNGLYPPGSFLPPEIKLAEQHQLSNKSVRKGLDTLVDEGLIVKINRVGNKVTGTGSKEKIVLTLGCSPSIERDFALQQLLADFHAQFPTIQVNTVTLSPGHPTAGKHFINTFKNYLENGIVDVLTLNPMYFGEFVDSNCLELLDPLSPQPEFYPFLNRAFTYQDNLYVQPIVFSPLVLCYNKEHFRKTGLPEPDSSWEWDDVVRSAEELAIPGRRHGLYFHLLSENRWPLFMLQSGMSFRAANDGEGEECELEGTKLLDNIRRVKQLVNNRRIFPGYLVESNDDVNQLFLEDRVSIIFSSYMNMSEFKHTNIQFDVAPIPYSDCPATLMIIVGLAVNANSQNKHAANLLLRYFASRRAQQKIRELTLSIPACKPIAEQAGQDNKSLNRPPHFAMFREHLRPSRVQRDLGLSDVHFYTLRSLLKKYWSDMIDEETLCREVRQQLHGYVLQ
ncbi:extracellular solute-binding protein [Paenibacillus sp. GCM10027626]|uniref:extracellular solute-binding protein n=1 Tax=Paenibacillus sp. GCM10027626 TaxID=3273411 RepID=UPI0036276D44